MTLALAWDVKTSHVTRLRTMAQWYPNRPVLALIAVHLVGLSYAEQIVQTGRTCDTETRICQVHTPRKYATLGPGVAHEEGGTIAYIKPCDAKCCKIECDHDIDCFSFSSRMNYCYLKDRCIQATDPFMKAKYITFFAKNCSGQRSAVRVGKPGNPRREPRFGGSASRTHRTTVDVEAARKQLALKGAGEFAKATPKKIIVGNVWEQMGEGVRSLSSAIVLAQITGRDFVLPYVANTQNDRDDYSVFKGNKANPYGDNHAFSSIFEVDEVRKCFPRVKMYSQLEDVDVGEDVIGIYFSYPNAKSHPFTKSLKRSKTGIIDCSKYALQSSLHIHDLDAFGHVPQMKKILCLDNDLRRRFTTRGLFVDLLGGYNTLYLINWRGIRYASHRVRLPDVEDKHPWGPLAGGRDCMFSGTHIFSQELNKVADSFVADEMAPLGSQVCSGHECSATSNAKEHNFMLIHLRLEKAQLAKGVQDGSLLPRFVESVRNVQEHLSRELGLPEEQLVQIYLATDALKSRTFYKARGLDVGLRFSLGVANYLDTVTFDCEAIGHAENSVACAAIELLIMARSKHMYQVGASTFSLWALEMMQEASTTRIGNKDTQGVCVYDTRQRDTIKFGQVYTDLVAPITFCQES